MKNNHISCSWSNFAASCDSKPRSANFRFLRENTMHLLRWTCLHVLWLCLHLFSTPTLLPLRWNPSLPSQRLLRENTMHLICWTGLWRIWHALSYSFMGISDSPFVPWSYVFTVAFDLKTPEYFRDALVASNQSPSLSWATALYVGFDNQTEVLVDDVLRSLLATSFQLSCFEVDVTPAVGSLTFSCVVSWRGSILLPTFLFEISWKHLSKSLPSSWW